MKAERQQKEKTSRVIQPSKGHGGYIVDNRSQSSSQANVKASIQRAENTKKLSSTKSLSSIQFARMKVIITGITHLVKAVDGSIFEGEETYEVSHGMKLEINTNHSIWSRRGPNQELEQNHDEDEVGAQIYEWYPVISINGRPISYNNYLRDETFIAPEELTTNKELIDEAVKGINRAKEKNKTKKGPKKITLEKVPADKKDKIEKKYNKELEAWRQGNKPKSLQELLVIVFQNIGTTFEKAAERFILNKHSGYDIYEGLKLGSQHELDFVIIQGDDVIIYSVKLDPAKVDPSVDIAHWNAIKKEWPQKRGKLLSGTDPLVPPQNDPLVIALSPQTFGMDGGLGFLKKLVPNWRTLLEEKNESE